MSIYYLNWKKKVLSRCHYPKMILKHLDWALAPWLVSFWENTEGRDGKRAWDNVWPRWNALLEVMGERKGGFLRTSRLTSFHFRLSGLKYWSLMNFLFLLFKTYSFNVCFACTCLHVPYEWVLGAFGGQSTYRTSWNRSCEPPCGCWDWNQVL